MCWRTEPTPFVSFLVDAENYFPPVRRAFRAARKQVLIVGWDIHSRVRLGDRQLDDGGIELGDLLREVAHNNPELDVRVLVWDAAPIYLLEREAVASFRFKVRSTPRVSVQQASDHPTGASHHQKIVVVDDTVAFSGGLDLTVSRWDTRGHQVDDARRVLPNGKSYGPFHDIQVAVGGPLAAALGDLARERIRRATGESLHPVSETNAALTPGSLGMTVDLSDVGVGIARTEPEYGDRAGVREAEKSTLAAISKAKRTIYIENQYFTSRTVCEALAGRLRDRNGPEIVLVLPAEQSGALEEGTMGVLRQERLRELYQADEYGRFFAYSPVCEDGTHVNVHSKVMIVDDRIVSVGSANMSDRSMALDTECNLVFEGRDPEFSKAVAALRTGLLSEHLDKNSVSAHGLISVIEEHRGSGRTLMPLRASDAPDPLLRETAPLGDPRQPLHKEVEARALPDGTAERGRARFPRTALLVLFALALVAAATTAMGGVSAEAVAEHVSPLLSGPWSPVLAVVAFLLASVLMFPVTALIAGTAIVFDGWSAAVISTTGALLSATVSYCLGRLVPRKAVERIAGDRLNRLTAHLQRNGALAMAAVRVIPIAPFSVVNMVAGAASIPFRSYLLGSAVGMLPGILGVVFASGGIANAIREPSFGSITIAIAGVAVVAAGLWLLGRFVDREPVPNPSRQCK